MMKKLTPKTAKTNEQICLLKRDNISTAKSWILVDEKFVNISNQRSGEGSIGSVTLTKKEFERFIRFYETGKQ